MGTGSCLYPNADFMRTIGGSRSDTESVNCSAALGKATECRLPRTGMLLPEHLCRELGGAGPTVLLPELRDGKTCLKLLHLGQHVTQQEEAHCYQLFTQ